ncbi:transglutaminase [Amycolatopsis antarctica]|uniref:Transglutaminase n=1 Tax=Amycolatopsis antarctica TaxID=1854586 RepID=A0A263D7L8_9PSEU|nr:DUF3488 and transglutaminase-like domain-containing protein [Amycolatopsis antarctica]OZM74423.1 transglutaminase [Amycolatopsis antarctica]
MTATMNRPPSPPPPDAPQPQYRPPVDWRSSVLAPLAAGVATLCASTSLTGVVNGWSWLGYVFVAVVLVACTGLALRSLRAPAFVVGMAQLIVLACLVTGVFTRSGILAIIPGPAALSELGDVLGASAEQIRTGLPPVEASPPILCLVVIAIGLVAVLVDTLAVAAAAPAATGLVLLCVYAVPASLSESMLPWVTFVLGAAAFAGLLAVDGSHRHRRWRNRYAPGLGSTPGSASTPVAVVCVAVVFGLVAGIAFTGIGTVGRLPGSSGDGEGTSTAGGLGVNPFTSLRGMLDQGGNVELFRVRGLGEDKRLLRAFTLDTYRPNQGWGLADGPMPAGVPAEQPLPAAPGDDASGETREIQIEPINWVDVWLPVYGAPRKLDRIPPGWFYDRTSGAVFSERKQRPPAYTVATSLAEPDKDILRTTAPGTRDLPPIYSDAGQVDPRVAELSSRLTENADNNFDKATEIWRYFTAQNGFTYDTQTAQATDADALADFVLNGKRGFCEQFASAMAVMLRAQGIPSRVAVGFTTGYTTGDYRAITSQDAHAWVEVYFGDRGWVSFDPTPLADGRGYVPPYLRPDDVPSQSPSETGEDSPSASESAQAPTGVAPEDQIDPDLGAAQGQDSPLSAPSWVTWGAVAAAVAALLASLGAGALARRTSALRRSADGAVRERPAAADWLPLAAAAFWVLAIALAGWLVHWTIAVVFLALTGLAMVPAAVRSLTRRRRLRTIAGLRSGAADDAWAELLDEWADRGTAVSESDTVRVTAQKVAQKHHLDEDGRDDLRTVIGVVERSWYSNAEVDDPAFVEAFNGVRRSLHKNAPMSWRGRLLPRSLFTRGKQR